MNREQCAQQLDAWLDAILDAMRRHPDRVAEAVRQLTPDETEENSSWLYEACRTMLVVDWNDREERRQSDPWMIAVLLALLDERGGSNPEAFGIDGLPEWDAFGTLRKGEGSDDPWDAFNRRSDVLYMLRLHLEPDGAREPVGTDAWYFDELRCHAAAYVAGELVKGRLWFDEQGHLNQSGLVPLSRYMSALSVQLRLFLVRLDSCERNEAGDYLLRDARAGSLGGMRVLWENVVLLSHAISAKIVPAMPPTGGIVRATAPTRNAQPLFDAMRQLQSSILWNADGSWLSEIPSATITKIRGIGDELPLHPVMWEGWEGGTTRTPEVTGSPGLLDRQQRAAAAEAIDEDDAALLAFLNQNPSLRRKVTDVLPESGPTDRKAVAKRLRKLANRTPPLVDYPKGGRSGVAILPAGADALKRATAPTPP